MRLPALLLLAAVLLARPGDRVVAAGAAVACLTYWRRDTMGLHLKPVTITEAKAVVGRLHRHNGVPQGGLFAVGCANAAGEVVGVAIIGRPVARALDDGQTCEVIRVATDGHRNACSLLYGAACRAAKALGYRTVYTYTLAEESGASLRASGWIRDAEIAPRPTWSCAARHRVQTDLFGEATRPAGPKVRWKRVLIDEPMETPAT